MQLRQWALVLAAAASLGLGACHRVADKAGTASPDTPTGTTGSGNTATMGGPGTGLQGGMNPAPGQPTGVADGSKNSTTSGAVGNR